MAFVRHGCAGIENKANSNPFIDLSPHKEYGSRDMVGYTRGGTKPSIGSGTFLCDFRGGSCHAISRILRCPRRTRAVVLFVSRRLIRDSGAKLVLLPVRIGVPIGAWLLRVDLSVQPLSLS